MSNQCSCALFSTSERNSCDGRDWHFGDLIGTESGIFPLMHLSSYCHFSMCSDECQHLIRAEVLKPFLKSSLIDDVVWLIGCGDSSKEVLLCGIVNIELTNELCMWDYIRFENLDYIRPEIVGDLDNIRFSIRFQKGFFWERYFFWHQMKYHHNLFNYGWVHS